MEMERKRCSDVLLPLRADALEGVKLTFRILAVALDWRGGG